MIHRDAQHRHHANQRQAIVGCVHGAHHVNGCDVLRCVPALRVTPPACCGSEGWLRGHPGLPAPLGVTDAASTRAKIVGPSAKRQLAEVLVQEHRLPVQQACRVVRLSRTAYYQPPVASRRDAAVIAALTDAVARYPRWGFWKLHDRLRAEGRPWNHKRLHRVYCALRLNLPRRTTRRVPRRVRQPLTAPPVLNRTWALDFMTETLYDRRRIRLLTVIDEAIAKAWRSPWAWSFPSRRVTRVLSELVALHGCPSALRTACYEQVVKALGAVHALNRRVLQRERSCSTQEYLAVG